MKEKKDKKPPVTLKQARCKLERIWKQMYAADPPEDPNNASDNLTDCFHTIMECKRLIQWDVEGIKY
jgi:hypothetical protein